MITNRSCVETIGRYTYKNNTMIGRAEILKQVTYHKKMHSDTIYR